MIGGMQRGAELAHVYRQHCWHDQRSAGMAESTIGMRSLGLPRDIGTRIIAARSMLVCMMAEMLRREAHLVLAIGSYCGPGKLQRHQDEQTNGK